jgi:hypothetical protein
MITLSLKDDGSFLGEIDEDDLQMLVDQLEEETETDTDYYITPLTIEMLEESGAGRELIDMLKEAVGDSEGVDIVWTES